jgi:hypothetical protein
MGGILVAPRVGVEAYHPRMDTHDWSVRSVALPEASRVTRCYARTHLADAFAVRLPDDAIDDPEQLARFVFAQQPPWIAALMRVRDALVAGFGIKTSHQLKNVPPAQRARRIQIFRIYETHAHEILLGEDDKHLDFRLSVLTTTQAAASGRQLILSTVVHCHNLLGRSYLRVIAPFHRRVVRATLQHAARVGWPLRQGS